MMLKSGVVSLTIQASEASSAMRMNIASPRPTCRAFFCWAAGSLPARIEMKITLSTPSTISRNVRVTSAIQASGEVIHSIDDDR